jgi:hypothetical protein
MRKSIVRFEDLPITFEDDVVVSDCGSWHRFIEREGTIAELLETWDIDNPFENSAMAQVLRHLRDSIKRNEELQQDILQNIREYIELKV